MMYYFWFTELCFISGILGYTYRQSPATRATLKGIRPTDTDTLIDWEIYGGQYWD